MDDVVTRLENEVEFLRQELATRDAEIQRRDAVLLSLSEGLKALNPPPAEARESPVSYSDGTDEGSSSTPPNQQEHAQRRSWWRAFFGLE